MGKKIYYVYSLKGIIALVMVLFLSCDNTSDRDKLLLSTFTPNFSAEEAFRSIEKQVQLGPRIPGSKAHHLCRKFIVRSLEESGYQPEINHGLVDSGNGILEIFNISGSYKPELKNRILLCGHYDSRLTADLDSLMSNSPVPGANDGASGTAVLLQLAKEIQKYDLDLGVDFIFFDGDDQGIYPESSTRKKHTWSLGAQYWARGVKKEYQYGIVLDMVGAENATFFKEDVSKIFAGSVQDKLWNIAGELGYDSFFIQKPIGVLVSDHYYINNLTKAKIPCLLVSDYRKDTEHGYFPYWHTTSDIPEHISKESLKAVGQSIIELLYTKS